MARKDIGRAAVILCLACLFARLLRRQIQLLVTTPRVGLCLIFALLVCSRRKNRSSVA